MSYCDSWRGGITEGVPKLTGLGVYPYTEQPVNSVQSARVLPHVYVIPGLGVGDNREKSGLMSLRLGIMVLKANQFLTSPKIGHITASTSRLPVMSRLLGSGGLKRPSF